MKNSNKWSERGIKKSKGRLGKFHIKTNKEREEDMLYLQKEDTEETTE